MDRKTNFTKITIIMGTIFSLILTLDSLFRLLPLEMYILLGLATIIIFVYRHYLSFLTKIFGYVKNQWVIHFSAYAFACGGFLVFISKENLKNMGVIVLLFVLLITFILGALLRRNFRLEGEKWQPFYEKLWGTKLTSKLLQAYRPTPRSTTVKINILSSEILPGMLIGLLNTLLFAIIFTLQIYSMLFAFILIIIILWNLTRIKHVKIPDFTKVLFDLSKIALSVKGFMGFVCIAAGYFYIGIFIADIVSKNFLFFLYPVFPLLFYILIFWIVLSQRYYHLTKTWKDKKFNLYNEVQSLPAGGDIAFFLSLLLFLLIIWLTKISFNAIITSIIALVSMITYYILIVLSIQKIIRKKGITEVRQLSSDKKRIPILFLLLMVTFGSFAFLGESSEWRIFFEMLYIGILIVYIFYFFDLYWFIENKNFSNHVKVFFQLFPTSLILVPGFFVRIFVKKPFNLVFLICSIIFAFITLFYTVLKYKEEKKSRIVKTK